MSYMSDTAVLINELNERIKEATEYRDSVIELSKAVDRLKAEALDKDGRAVVLRERINDLVKVNHNIQDADNQLRAENARLRSENQEMRAHPLRHVGVDCACNVHCPSQRASATVKPSQVKVEKDGLHTVHYYPDCVTLRF